MKQFSILLGLIFLLFTSACGGQKKSTQVLVKPDMSSFRGKATDKIICRLDSNLSYALYLPSSYDGSKTYPLLIAFDSHGDGRLPLSIMKEQAEKYQYIIVGSNNSKNGLSSEVTSSIYDGVIQDVKWRLSVDSQRIYTMGFSGGARVAAYQGFNKSGIRAVIGCSAGLPSNTNPSTASLDYFGVVGTDDFNYLEMKMLFNQLDQTNLPHYLMTFDGIHAWPPKESIEDIFTFLQFTGMKEGVIAKDTHWISEVKRNLMQKIESNGKENNWLKSLEINRMALFLFKGLPDANEFVAKEQQIMAKKEVVTVLQEQQKWLTKEEGLQKEYLQYFNSKNSTWWKAEVQRLNSLCKQKKGSVEAHVYKRLLSYLSLACYMNANQALKTSQWEGFRYFVAVYTLVDPENSETAYLQAIMDMKDNQAVKAISSLNTAIKLGFTDLNRLQKDSAFLPLHEQKEFITICNTLNNKK